MLRVEDITKDYGSQRVLNGEPIIARSGIQHSSYSRTSPGSLLQGPPSSQITA